jgi:hypothetical protein
MGVHKRNQTPIAVSSQRCLAPTDFQIDGRLGAAWPARSDASAPGEWAGPLVGELGILERDDAGERLQCHICGASFHFLGVHAARPWRQVSPLSGALRAAQGDAPRERSGSRRQEDHERAIAGPVSRANRVSCASHEPRSAACYQWSTTPTGSQTGPS